MKKEVFEVENDVDVKVDVERKNEVKKELDYCKSTLEKEFENLHSYQEQYFCWINTRKDVLNSMKKNVSTYGYEYIIHFCDYRNHFLVKKCIQIKRYITAINKMIKSIDVLDFVEIESIDTKLRLMLISLGMTLPTEIFGEPF